MDMRKTSRVFLSAVLAGAGILTMCLAGCRDRTAPRPGGSAGAALPRLVDLGSTTCEPCKLMAPILEDLKRDCAGRLAVEFIDVTVNPAAGKQYGIKLIPTQIFLDAAGQERFRHEGFYSREEILAKWKELGVDLTGPGTAPAGNEPPAIKSGST